MISSIWSRLWVISVFWSIATRRDVVRRALKTALLVGIILIAINHGDALMALNVDGQSIAKMLLTLAVPYCVSTYSSVKTIQHYEADSR